MKNKTHLFVIYYILFKEGVQNQYKYCTMVINTDKHDTDKIVRDLFERTINPPYKMNKIKYQILNIGDMTEDFKKYIQENETIYKIASRYFYEIISYDIKEKRYTMKYYLEPRQTIINELFEDKKLNILYLCHGNDDLLRKYSLENINYDFGELYHIKNITSTVYSLRDEKNEYDLEGLKNIIEVTKDIEYVILLPMTFNLTIIKRMLKCFHHIDNIKVYMKDYIYDKLYLVKKDADLITVKEVVI